MSQKIAYTIERSARRKHTYLSLQKDGTVLVRANMTISNKAIETFVTGKKRWIEEKVRTLSLAQETQQKEFYLLGELLERKERSQEDIDLLYSRKAREIIPPLVAQYSEKMGLFPSRLSFRKNRSRWGSCSSKNNLSFNTQLAQTPPEFIEYVVVHELAHILHKNHSRDFWRLVERYLPDYKERKELVRNRHYLL